jgi:hypothetical protein
MALALNVEHFRNGVKRRRSRSFRACPLYSRNRMSRIYEYTSQSAEPEQQETVMPFRRGGFTLTPPSVVVFPISIVLAALAMLVHYVHVSVPIINASRVF